MNQKKFILLTMQNLNLREKLARLGFLGVTAHHYGGKLLDYKNTLAETQAQEARDALMNKLENKVTLINSILESMQERLAVKGVKKLIILGLRLIIQLMNNFIQ